MRSMYTYKMPNKTIYLRDADLPLFEQAQEQLGDSISSVFAEFLRERMGNLNPAEGRIANLIHQISEKRAAIKKERGVPEFVDGGYAEAESYAEKALKKLRAGEIRTAKIFLWAANAYLESAERAMKNTKQLREKIAEMLELEKKSDQRPRR